MSVCEQSSQRATWPPSAAVRQLSIADITLSWPRLTWPALALRHAGPWRRKISATSKAGRDTSAARQLGGQLPLSFTAICSSGLMTSRIVLVATRVYCAVVSSLAWPSRTWITRMSMFCSSRCVAKL
jgi:hypothetical protein